jgi:NTP pyrophosphatase (non-canonical NTP hydrolase)
MDFNQYQREARDFAVYPEHGCIYYPVALLAEEAGEVAGKLAKAIRASTSINTPQFTEAISKEMGDVLWALANLAEDLGIDLEDVAKGNLAKLRDRQQRGVIVGEGDNR